MYNNNNNNNKNNNKNKNNTQLKCALLEPWQIYSQTGRQLK